MLWIYSYLVESQQVDEIVVVVLLPVDLDTSLMINAMILANLIWFYDLFWGGNYFITWPFFLPLSRAKKTCKIKIFPSSFNSSRSNSSLWIKSLVFKHIVVDLKVAPHCSHDMLLSLTGDRHCHFRTRKKCWLLGCQLFPPYHCHHKH